MSFGAWVALTAGAEDARVSLLAGIAPPVDRYNFSVLLQCRRPKFLIHGEDDEIVPVRQVRAFYATLPEPKELAVIDEANHLFEGKAALVGDTIEDLLGDFHG
jgi:alpha/beta superfamily hydrolase